MHPLNLIRSRLLGPEECARTALGLERAPRFAGAGAGAGFGSSPSPWTPAALGAAQWQRADLDVSLSGADVLQWSDQSGNAIHLTTGAGTRTTRVAVATQCGFVIRGNGAQHMAFAANTLGTANTIGIVCTPTSGTDDYWFDSSATGKVCMLSKFGGLSYEWLGNFADRLTFSAGATGMNALLVTQTDGGALNLYINSATPVATKVVVGNPLNGLTMTKLFSNNAGGNVVTGDCAEFLRVARVITPAEIAQWFAYCHTMHGTP